MEIYFRDPKIEILKLFYDKTKISLNVCFTYKKLKSKLKDS